MKTTFLPTFGEVDSLRIMWHGNYTRYFEIGRQLFENKYDLGIDLFYENGITIPLSQLNIKYINGLEYNKHYTLITSYVLTKKPVLRFEYKILNSKNKLFTKAYTEQVFYSEKDGLLLKKPDFLIGLNKRMLDNYEL